MHLRVVDVAGSTSRRVQSQKTIAHCSLPDYLSLMTMMGEIQIKIFKSIDIQRTREIINKACFTIFTIVMLLLI